VNVTGDTMTGDLVVQANIDQDQSRFISGETTASSVFPFTGVQFSGITFGSAEITITAKDGANRHITKLLITHNNSTVIATEYGTVYTSSELANYDVNLTAGNVNVTFASVSGSTNFKIAGTLLKA
jgi:PKD repeat protein